LGLLPYEHRIRALEEDAVQSPRKEYKACVHPGAADLLSLPGYFFLLWAYLAATCAASLLCTLLAFAWASAR